MRLPNRARGLGLIACEGCGLVIRGRAERRAHPGHCPRCHAVLHPRRPDAIRRSWAFLIAAALLYVPANVLPILTTRLGLDVTASDTILSGVVGLWTGGNWDLAIVVFSASIVVPLLKIGAMALLLITTQQRSRWRLQERAQLYRLLELIGHWSMLDVFAVALLITLVHFGPLAQVEPGVGIVVFGAVVVLTMLSTLSFDPRLIWDAAEGLPPP